MASAFPGMDPYLEDPAYWLDFHSRFVNAWCEAIADQLPPDYEAGLDERVYLVEPDPNVRKLIRADAAVLETPGELVAGSPATGGVATLEPVTIPLTILDGPREAYIELLHLPERSLITVLELLSPANKEQPNRTEYLAKRRALIYQKVHLVELDLLVGGKRLPMEKPLPPGDYYYFVSRSEQRPDCQVYSWKMPHPLPRLPVPLRPPDPDILIDLGEVFRIAYERGRFQRRIRYNGPPPVSLSDAQRAWADTQVRAR